MPIKIINAPQYLWLQYFGLSILILGAILGIIALLQLNTKLSPFPSPVKNGSLITSGVFAIARHPIYTAILFMAFGYAFLKMALFKFLVSIALLILFYFKSKYEEILLQKKFPSYSKYKIKTRRFL